MPKKKNKIPVQNIPYQNKVLEKTKPRIETVGKAKISTKPLTVNFSFKFWRQIPYFGLDRVDLKWVVAFLDRLAEFSAELLDEFRTDRRKQKLARYHLVEWGGKNIPIQRSELTWLDKDYLDNEKEISFYQIHITKGLGSLVGFWDEHDIFNVVLLDPFHNIYLTQKTGYRLDKCYPLQNMYASLVDDMRQAKQSHNCPNVACSLQKRLNDLPLAIRPSFNVVLFHLDNEKIAILEKLLNDNKCRTVDEVLQAGIEYLS